MNRFKGLDLADRMPEKLWKEVCNTVQGVGPKPFQRKRKARKQSDCLRKLYKLLREEEKQKGREKGKDIPI